MERFTHILGVSAALVAIAVFSGCGGGSSSGNNKPVPTDKIAFASSRSGAFQIYIMNIDGSSQTALTSFSGTSADTTIAPKVSLSPKLADGSRMVAFDYPDPSQNSQSELWLVKTDTTGIKPNGQPQRLFTGNDAFADTSPSWSPDGTKLAFVRSDTSGSGTQPAVYMVGIQTLSSPVKEVENGDSPCWMMDNRNIAYVSYEDGFANIYAHDTSMGVAGNNSQLTLFAFDANMGIDSIAYYDNIFVFSTYETNGATPGQIYSVDSGIAATVPGHLLGDTIQNQYDDAGPGWTTDGRIVYFSGPNSGSSYDIYIMNADGTGRKQLTTSGDNGFPSSRTRRR